jgi:hypothetical protein
VGLSNRFEYLSRWHRGPYRLVLDTGTFRDFDPAQQRRPRMLFGVVGRASEYEAKRNELLVLGRTHGDAMRCD